MGLLDDFFASEQGKAMAFKAPAPAPARDKHAIEARRLAGEALVEALEAGARHGGTLVPRHTPSAEDLRRQEAEAAAAKTAREASVAREQQLDAEIARTSAEAKALEQQIAARQREELDQAARFSAAVSTAVHQIRMRTKGKR